MGLEKQPPEAPQPASHASNPATHTTVKPRTPRNILALAVLLLFPPLLLHIYPSFLPSFLLSFIASPLDFSSSTYSHCKPIPGDPTWPSPSAWAALNVSVEGRLVRTVPFARACHEPDYDAAECEEVRRKWHLSEYHESSSSSIMAPLWVNKSCDAFTAPSEPCVIGAYVQYAVNVSTPNDVFQALAFVREHGVRFVVRNTGHDYMGKSTGTGALAVWTHHLQSREWTDAYDRNGSDYNGAAVKVGAGVTFQMLYEDAAKRGLMVIGGMCPNVGFAGGYIQGGGHSILSSVYGLAADHTLEFEVITTDGRLVIASPTENQDLYWALSGGGGGTYGVVWTVTVKAFPDIPITLAQIVFTSEHTSHAMYLAGLEAWLAHSSAYPEEGAFAVALYSNVSFTMPLVAPLLTEAEVTEMLRPFREALDGLGIAYYSAVNEYDGFWAAHAAEFAFLGDIPVGIAQFGGRIMPRGIWEAGKGGNGRGDGAFAMLVETVRGVIDGGGSMMEFVFRPRGTRVVAKGYVSGNAVHPAWRGMDRLLLTTLPWKDLASWNQVVEDQRRITWEFGEPLRRLSPGSGAYLNEADPFEPDWKDAFYGANYGRLLEIKDRWDVGDVMYGPTAVGSDRWRSDGDGRLCRVA